MAAAVVAVAVRAGISARRDAVLVLPSLGATDAEVAGRFARRVAVLVGAGRIGRHARSTAGAVGAGLGGGAAGGAADWRGLPWLDLALVPPVAAWVGWVTTQATVRLWLRRLP